MSECKKNTDIPLLGQGNVQVKNIRFASDKKTIEVFNVDNLSIVCTMNLDSTVFVGVKIVNNNLIYTEPISNLAEEESSSIANNPAISINFVGGVLNIIGADDTSLGFTCSQVNVRYDARDRKSVV